MLNHKQITRKKSQQVLPSKQSIDLKAIKRKKSVSNLHTNKSKRQTQKQFKHNDKASQIQKHQLKLVSSTSKGKLKTKACSKNLHLNDQNNINLQNKKSAEKLHHTKSIKDHHLDQKKQQKLQNACKLSKSKSLYKLHPNKKSIKSKQIKQSSEVKIKKIKKCDNLANTKKPTIEGKRSISKVQVPSKKLCSVIKPPNNINKAKKSHQPFNNAKKTNASKVKIRKNKISQLIQKSILYSDVNYDFKEQISFLGSGIKQNEQFFLQYPFESQQIQFSQNRQFQSYQTELQYNAAVMIQKNFRGYLHRKYMKQAQQIIRCIKTIQRAWRKYKLYKDNKMNNLKHKQSLHNHNHKDNDKFQNQEDCLRYNRPHSSNNNNLGEVSTSLITIKDLNDTLMNRSQNKKLFSELNANTFRGDSKENTINLNGTTNAGKVGLEELIKGMLEDEGGISQNLKNKIKEALKTNQEKIQSQPLSISQEKTQSKQQMISNQKLYDKPDSLSDISQVRSNHSQSHHQQEENINEESDAISQEKNIENQQNKQIHLQDHPFDKSRDIYVQRKIDTEIQSQKQFFKSPMRQSPHHLMGSPAMIKMTSPAMSKMISPKCLSSSLGKDPKNSYNQYFKSNKISSSGAAIFTSPIRSIQSSPKLFKELDEALQKQNNPNSQNHHNGNHLYKQEQKCKEQQIKRQKLQLQLRKEDYLNELQIQDYSSPVKPYKPYVIEKQQDHLISTDKKGSQIELETRRIKKNDVNVNQFPTAFYLIEQFCLCITDYLRNDSDTIEVFLEKLKTLKYFKTQQVFKQWSGLQFQEMSVNNEPLQQIIMRSNCQRPTIFSKSQRKLILQFPSLRIFLDANDYQKSQIVKDRSPQNAYITFMLDIFQESLYQSLSVYSLRDISLSKYKQSKSNQQYLSMVFSETMGNIMKSAEMLCGRFQTDDMNEYDIQENAVINQVRIDQMTHQLEPFDQQPCQIWINLLISQQIFDQLVTEATLILGESLITSK